MKLHLFLLVSVLLILTMSQSGIGQDSLLFIDGECLVLTKYKFDDEARLLLYESKRGKVKEEDLNDLYSIAHTDGSIEMFYTPDSSNNDFSVQEMGSFIKGEQDAIMNYKSPWTFISSAAVGVVSPFALGQYWSFASASGIPIIISFVPLKEKHFRKRHPEVTDVHFTAGYLKKAETIRTKIAFKGAGIGFSIGFVALFAIAYTR